MKTAETVLSNVESTIACALGESVNVEPGEEDTENIEALAGKRVLLVDDNELNREIMKEVLVGHGLILWHDVLLATINLNL